MSETEVGAKPVASARSAWNRLGQGAALIVGVLGLSGAAIFGSGLLGEATGVQAGVPSPLNQTHVVALDQGELIAVCPPGVADPTIPSAADAVSKVWQSTSVQTVQLSGGGTALHIPTTVLNSGPYAGASVAGQKQGDLASFLVESCVLPARIQTLPGGSTQTGEDTVLILSNPNAKPVTVSVQVLSPVGALLDSAMQIVVAAESSVSVLPASWAPGEERIGLHVEADGLGVAAWLQNSGLEGEVPQGVGRMAGQSASTTSVVTGVNPESAQWLRIANPGTEPLAVQVNVLGRDGRRELEGIEGLVVEGKGVFDVDVTSLPSDAFALEVLAEGNVAASVMESAVGNPFAQDETLSTGIRTAVASGDPIHRAVLPDLAQLGALVEDAGLGKGSGGATLTLANPGEEEAAVLVGAQEVTVGPGASVQIEVFADAGVVVVQTETPVHMALTYQGVTDAGTTDAVLALREDVSTTATVTVVLGPAR